MSGISVFRVVILLLLDIRSKNVSELKVFFGILHSSYSYGVRECQKTVPKQSIL